MKNRLEMYINRRKDYYECVRIGLFLTNAMCSPNFC